MNVTIIDRAAQAAAWGKGSAGPGSFLRTVEIADICPTCGGPRGAVVRRHMYEDGDIYDVDTWENPCGHVDTYAAVITESEEHETECNGRGCNATFDDRHPGASFERVVYGADRSGYDDFSYCPACTVKRAESQEPRFHG